MKRIKTLQNIYIYCYTNIKNGMEYVGQTNNMKKRDRDHKANRGDTYFDRAYHKHPEDFKLRIIGTTYSAQSANVYEMFYIAYLGSKYPNGYNLTDGGGGCRGYKQTEEHKKKIGEANSGKPTWNKGSHLTDDWKRKISESNKGKKYPARSGENNHNAMSTRNKDNGMEFYTRTQAVEWLKQNGYPKAAETNITKCCQGKRQIAYGYHWEDILLTQDMLAY